MIKPTCYVRTNELLHHIEQTFVGPDIAKPTGKVTHFVQKNSSSFELLLYQSEPLIEAGVLTFVLDLSSIVEFVHQNVHRLVHRLHDYVHVYTQAYRIYFIVILHAYIFQLQHYMK